MIDKNELTGSIPMEIGLLTTLEYLTFSKQMISVLLLCFKTNYIRSLLLIFSFNFSSPENVIAENIVLPSIVLILFFESCLLFSIDNNKLKGSIPSELGSLISLQTLNLGMYYNK